MGVRGTRLAAEVGGKRWLQGERKTLQAAAGDSVFSEEEAKATLPPLHSERAEGTAAARCLSGRWPSLSV